MSAIRLRELSKFANSKNPTYDNVPAAYWSAIEANTGIICACLPACRSLLGKAYKKAREYTSFSSLRSKTITGKQSTGTNSSKMSKTPRLSTLYFRSTGVEGTFVGLEQYASTTKDNHVTGIESAQHNTPFDDDSDASILESSRTRFETSQRPEVRIN